MVYRLALRKKQEAELVVVKVKMLRFSLGATRMSRIENGYIRGTAHVRFVGEKPRETELRWFEHAQRRDSEYVNILGG